MIGDINYIYISNGFFPLERQAIVDEPELFLLSGIRIERVVNNGGIALHAKALHNVLSVMQLENSVKRKIGDCFSLGPHLAVFFRSQQPYLLGIALFSGGTSPNSQIYVFISLASSILAEDLSTFG